MIPNYTDLTAVADEETATAIGYTKHTVVFLCGENFFFLSALDPSSAYALGTVERIEDLIPYEEADDEIRQEIDRLLAREG